MSYKTLIVVVAVTQAVFGQYVSPGSTVTGNSVVNNDIFIGGGSSYGLGAGLGGIGLGGVGLGSSTLGLGSIGIGSGLGLGIGSGIGIGAGLGASTGLISAGTLAGLSGYNVVASGPLAVTTISPIGPSGLAVASENALSGNLAVSGQLPFLSAVAFEGALPTAGSGVATCGCGSGNVGIVSEGFPASSAIGIGSGLGLGSGIGLGNIGIGSGIGGLYY